MNVQSEAPRAQNFHGCFLLPLCSKEHVELISSVAVELARVPDLITNPRRHSTRGLEERQSCAKRQATSCFWNECSGGSGRKPSVSASGVSTKSARPLTIRR